MSRKPLSNPTNADVYSFSSGNDGTLVNATMRRVNSDGSVESSGDTAECVFLLNPSTIDENKTSNWVQHAIPGQSGPILQWVSGGARTLSFEALVTNDTAYYSNITSTPSSKLISTAISAVGSIASKFAGVNLPSLINFIPSPSSPGDLLDISNNLDFYRSLLTPDYDTNYDLVQSPPLVVLDFGKALTTSFPDPVTQIDTTTTLWALTNLSIKITKQMPDLCPMEAVVNFQFIEYLVIP